MKTIALLFFLFHSQLAFACREVDWTTEQWAQKASAIYIGKIYAISVTEDYLKAVDSVDTIHLGVDRVIQLKVFETLKGEKVDNLEVLIDWCRGGQFEFLQPIILFKVGHEFHLKSISQADTVKAALGSS